MPDSARSDSPAVQAQLDRLGPVSVHGDRLGLERVQALCERLGRPQDQFAPVFHVAGTNGKGSTCAFLRAALEAAGHRVHVFTSPHLVRFNERIRVAGRLIDDEPLAALLEEAIDAAAGLEASFFEVTTAASFLAFARTPAAACIIEVGLGGRLDATNVIERPLVCGIASLGLDHQQFLGHDIRSIAREKAGIAKRGVPLVTLGYDPPAMESVQAAAGAAGAPLYPAFRSWHFGIEEGRLHYRDDGGELSVPLPGLEGRHQVDNCALAIAMLRHQGRIEVPPEALEKMPLASWPGRLQRLAPGPLTEAAAGATIWIDGGHNPDAAGCIADWLGRRQPLPTVILGLLANKDAPGFLAPIVATGCPIVAVPVPGHDCHPPELLAQIAHSLGAGFCAAAPGFAQAVRGAGTSEIAILGSLYLAGEALRANNQLPD